MNIARVFFVTSFGVALAAACGGTAEVSSSGDAGTRATSGGRSGSNGGGGSGATVSLSGSFATSGGNGGSGTTASGSGATSGGTMPAPTDDGGPAPTTGTGAVPCGNGMLMCSAPTAVCCMPRGGAGGGMPSCVADPTTCPAGSSVTACVAGGCSTGQVCCRTGGFGRMAGGGAAMTACTASGSCMGAVLCAADADCASGEVCGPRGRCVPSADAGGGPPVVLDGGGFPMFDGNFPRRDAGRGGNPPDAAAATPDASGD